MNEEAEVAQFSPRRGGKSEWMEVMLLGSTMAEVETNSLFCQVYLRAVVSPPLT